jgi:uncharacterized protein YcbK (DUF882 family)
MDVDFMDRLQLLRTEWYKESTRILKVSSGFRCRKHNARVSKFSRSDGSGPHTLGKAVDILISGNDATKLFKMAKQYMSGIGYSFKGRSRYHYLHLDTLTPEEADRPAVWAYK